MQKYSQFTCLMVVSSTDREKFLKPALNSITVDQKCMADQYVIVRNGKLQKEKQIILNEFGSKFPGIFDFLDLKDRSTLSVALNYGLKACKFNFVARMDPDDLSLSDRFCDQLNLLNTRPEIAICGTWIGEFSDSPELASLRILPTTNSEIIIAAKKRNPLAHSSVMFRKSLISSLGGYPEVKNAQDYLLWSSALMAGYQIVNIPKILVLFRLDKSLAKRRGWNYFKSEFEIFRQMRQIGFLTNSQFLINSILRAIIRMQPVIVRDILYRMRR